MNDLYYRDFDEITLSDYEKELSQTELLHSRMIIKENLHERFESLKRQNIRTLSDLLSAVKTSAQLSLLAGKAGIPEEFLVILKREISSNIPKPVRLKDFPSVSSETVEKLAAAGINDTRQLFQSVKTEKERQELSDRTGVFYFEILELTKLTDVSRIKWVGANFARVLVDSGYNTAQNVSDADAGDLLQQK